MKATAKNAELQNNHFQIYKKDTHQNILLGTQPKRKQIGECHLTNVAKACQNTAQ